MISVCMAVYNGGQYVADQISSILEQLGDCDELVVVDDCSTDNSYDLVTGINDPRIKCHKNNVNLGVFETFESAIRRSLGDIIFLSDQDDIWYPQKVEKTMHVFNTSNDVTMVASDATIIDCEGEIKQGSFFAKRGKFKSGLISTVLKNKYLGCTLAFRRSLVDKLLPIPKDVPMHDIWLGALNSIYGKTYFIDEPLIYYRRHDNNLSSIDPSNFTRQLLWRLLLVKNLAKRVLCLVVK